MTPYRVTFTVDAAADSPEAAAKEAIHQLRSGFAMVDVQVSWRGTSEAWPHRHKIIATVPVGGSIT